MGIWSLDIWSLGIGYMHGEGRRSSGGYMGIGSLGIWSHTVQGTGCRVQGAGCRVQGAGCRMQGGKAQGTGCRVQGAGYRVQVAGCRVRPIEATTSIPSSHPASCLGLCGQSFPTYLLTYLLTYLHPIVPPRLLLGSVRAILDQVALRAAAEARAHLA